MVTDLNIDPRIFNKVYYPHLDNMARVQIFYGGSSSGKSWFLAQRTIYDILRGGRNYLVARAVARTMRKSVINELEKAIEAWGVAHLFKINKTDGVITCVNGYQIIFAGLDDVEKIKSMTPRKGVITDIWVEEATETSRPSIKQLLKRQRGGSISTPKRLVLSFNPIVKTHWIYDEYFKPILWRDDQTEYTSPKLSILKTWYVHNRFITQGDIDTLLDEKDEQEREVYAFGNWGVLGDLIFKNWRVEDLSKKRPLFDNIRHGLDWGFGVDPAAFTSTYCDRKRKRLYIFQEFAGVGLTNDILAEMMEPLIDDGLVYCDSAEPKSIAEIQGYGIRAIGAKKGKGGISHGIKWLKQQEIIIDSSCVGVANEFGLYSWKKNRYGESLPVPEDKNNHFIDGLRYQYEDMADGGVKLLW